MAKLAKKGHTISPVRIEGRAIAGTFWGKAWCDNLESYSDFANRLPRGRTYVRNGSVVDLQIKPGKVTARVIGSELYNVEINIHPLSKPRWRAISSQCAGKIASVLELLQGRFSRGVMEIMTNRGTGLFPKPSEISLGCSCPDWAEMCKHVAAALYGVGARLDQEPELLFVLRKVDHMELIEKAVAGQAFRPTAGSGSKTIAEGDLADVFGIELDDASSTISRTTAPTPAARPKPKKKAKAKPKKKAATRSPRKAGKAPAKKKAAAGSRKTAAKGRTKSAAKAESCEKPPAKRKKAARGGAGKRSSSPNKKRRAKK